METDGHTDEEIRQILGYKRVAVIGISRDPQKAAHYVPKYLSENGYNVTPVNPGADEILGKKCYSGIKEVDHAIDIVDVFRPSGQVMSVIRDVIEKKPRVVWLQEGIHDAEAERLAGEAGIDVVFNRCMLAEHRRLG